MSLWHDLGLLAPVWVTGLCALIVLLLTLFGGPARPIPGGERHLAIVALLGLGVSLWVLVGGGRGSAFSGAISLDGLGATFGAIVLLGGAVSVLLATAYLEEHGMTSGGFYALILLSTCGALVLSVAGGVMVLFIGVELMSLAVYVLAGCRRASSRSQEAAFKYFVYGAFASAFVIFGAALLYGEVGRSTGEPALSFVAVGRAFSDGVVSRVGWVGVTMVLGGLGFKIAAVPFHMWAPDVYEGAPTPSTAYMAVAVKTGAFAGMCRFVAATLLAGGTATETAIRIIEIFAVLTIVVGNLVAVRQTGIKRMLAYSSVAHTGYALVGIVAFVAGPRGDALTAVAHYLLAYTAMTLGAFGVVLAFERRDSKRETLTLDRLSGVGHQHPALGLAMCVFMFSLAGVPPTAGFVGKLSVLCAAVHAQRVPVVVVAVLMSVVGAYYCLRVLAAMYMTGVKGDAACIRSAWLTAGLWACAVVTLVAGITPESAMGLAREALSGWVG